MQKVVKLHGLLSFIIILTLLCIFCRHPYHKHNWMPQDHKNG